MVCNIGLIVPPRRILKYDDKNSVVFDNGLDVDLIEYNHEMGPGQHMLSNT